MSEKIRVDEVTRRIGVSARTLQNWAERGIGPKRHRLFSSVYYHSDEVDEFAKLYEGLGRVQRCEAMVEAKEAQQ